MRTTLLRHTDLLAGGTEVLAVDVVVVIVVGHTLVTRLALALKSLDLEMQQHKLIIDGL